MVRREGSLGKGKKEGRIFPCSFHQDESVLKNQVAFYSERDKGYLLLEVLDWDPEKQGSGLCSVTDFWHDHEQIIFSCLKSPTVLCGGDRAS